MPLTLDFILSVSGGTLIGPRTEHPLASVCIDSRVCKKGDLFVCLAGEKVDGHDYAADAIAKGCSAILAARNPFTHRDPPVPTVIVHNPASTLRTLATAWRDEYAKTSGKVIGITGTAGKTTIKEMLAHVLGQVGVVSYTPRNLNNSLGVPLSLLNARIDAFCWVIEAGISHAGDMEELGAMIRPDLALILNAGPGHTAGLGNRGTAHHKAQLLRFIRPGGEALVNADYPELVREARNVFPGMMFFTSSGKQVEYRAAYVKPLEDGHGSYRLWLENKPIDAVTPFIGSYSAENFIAVAAVAHRMGLNDETILRGLRDITLPPQRFCKIDAGNWLIIDDSYNANPLSMSRMLSATVEIGQGKPLYCMLGEMGELGTIAEAEHDYLGRLLADLRPEAVFWTGGYFEQIKNGFERGRASGALYHVDGIQSFMEAVEPHIEKGGVIIFKGSRFNRLEHFVTAFFNRVKV